MTAAMLSLAAFAAPAQARDEGKGLTAQQLLKRALDAFLAGLV